MLTGIQGSQNRKQFKSYSKHILKKKPEADGLGDGPMDKSISCSCRGAGPIPSTHTEVYNPL